MDSDIAAALESADLTTYFSNLPPSHKREYLHWITSAKKDSSRQNRIKKMLTMLQANQAK